MRNLMLVSCKQKYYVWIMVLVLIGVMISPLTAAATEKQVNVNAVYDVGDVNRDGKVNSLDYGSIRAYLLGMEEFRDIGQRLWEADVNGDGMINSIDFAYFRMRLLEGTKFPKVHKKVNTVITTVEYEPLYLVANSPFAILEFSVILRDEAGNPLGGKKVGCNKPGEFYNIENPTETDENGFATFSFRQAHTDQVPFRTYEVDIGIYFDGDEEYSACEYTAKAMISNNGGPQRTTSPNTPTPAPTPR